VAGVFILGAYPSAQFETVGAENDVPVGDNLGPFEPQRYFDGRRVRTQASADELEAFYLAPLEISRSECWVTDLVKVSLFKEGHREKYARLGATPPARYERERFEELATRSLPWIERELELARPKLVITLGAEIAGIVGSVTSPTRRNALLGPGITPARFGAREFPTAHLAHPGIVMRKGDGAKNPWPKLHEHEHMPALKAALALL
jgi:uracil-DNA glycosylase